MTLRIESNPRVEVATSIGQVFVFESPLEAVKAYADQPPADVVDQVRVLLTSNASTSDRTADGNRPAPLSDEQAKALTGDDVENLAAGYLRMPNSLYSIAKGKEATPPLVRAEGESSVRFLDRLLRWWPSFERAELEEMRKSMLSGGSQVLKAAEQMRSATDKIARIGRAGETAREMMDRMLDSSALRAIEKLQLNATGLSRAIEAAELQRGIVEKLRIPESVKIAEHLKALERANVLFSPKPPAHLRDLPPSPVLPEIISPQPISMPSSARQLQEAHEKLTEAQGAREARRQAERDEELKLARRLEEVNIRSSSLLVELTETSKIVVTKLTEFLVDFKESTQQAAAGARTNLQVAMWSLIVAAGLAFVGGVYTVMSYNQDKTNNAGDDLWQAEVSGLLKSQAAAGEKARQDLAVENGQLRQRIDALEKALSEIPKPPAKNAEAKQP